MIIFFVVIALIASTVMISFFDSDDINIERDKKTIAALAEAKAALIGYAAAINLPSATCTDPNNNCARLGDLPCPDTNDDGIAEGSCGNAAGTTQQANRIGRLPWKTLGLADLRDGYGERLWYAVSNNFKNNTRTSCIAPSDAGCLNSDTGGTITLRNASGIVINNGSTGAGVAAVILSPGSPIARNGVLQDRGCVGCSLVASNYLDILVGTDDNASFTDSSAVDGFIQGPVKDGNQNSIINDTLATVSVSDIISPLEKRVATEVLNCLKDYALNNPGGIDRHPWSTDPTPALYPTYADSSNHRIGRIPDTPFGDTYDDSWNGVTYLMNRYWGSCKIPVGLGWWMNWKVLVFYAVGWDKDPSNSFPVLGPPASAPACNDDVPNDCLTIITPSGNLNHKKAAVIVAGKALVGQARGTNLQRGTIANYLEDSNAASTAATRNPQPEDAFFEQKPATAIFNDVVVFY